MITDKHHAINETVRRLVRDLNDAMEEAYKNGMDVELDVARFHGSLGSRLRMTPKVSVRMDP